VVVLVGLGRPLATLPIVNAAVREIDIRGVFRYANCYPAALSLIATGQIDVKPLITHRYTIKESVEAFEMAESGQAIKVMVSIGLCLFLLVDTYKQIILALSFCVSPNTMRLLRMTYQYFRFNVAMKFNTK
jgi:hypothetical protein